MIKMFTAPWCSYCTIMRESLLPEDMEGVTFVNVDEHPLEKEKYNIKVIPYFVKLDEDGNVLKQHSGSMSRADFLIFKDHV